MPKMNVKNYMNHLNKFFFKFKKYSKIVNNHELLNN